MICIYDARDTAREGHGLGVLHPASCTITETAGGSYELTMELPLGLRGEAALIHQEAVLRVPGAPHRLSAREQLFRICSVSVGGDGKTMAIKAQHLFYDLARTAVQKVETAEETSCGELARQMMAGLIEPANFVLNADCNGTAKGTWALVTPVNMLLEPSTGLVAQGHLEMERDGSVLRLRDDTGRDSGVTLRYGGSLRSLTASHDIQSVVTRLYPMGENEDGSDLMLPEKAIDAPLIGDYAAPRIAAWKVSGAKVGQKTRRDDGSTQALTVDEVYAMLREAAADRLREGCDKVQETLSFVHVPRPVAIRGAAESLCLYDRVRIRHEAAGLECERRITGYTWDVLRGCYESLEAGDPWQDRTGSMLATSAQVRQTAAAARRTFENYGEQLYVEAEQIVLHARQIALLADNAADVDKRVSSAEIMLDGMNARIELLATDISNQGDRISQAEIAIDGANARIDLKANQTTVESLGTRVSAAEVAIDGANAAIALKASQTTVDSLGTRVSAAEIAIDGANAEIALKVSKDGVVSAINMSTEGVKIKASKIELSGTVLAGYLNGTSIDVNELSASMVYASGGIQAPSATIDGAYIGDLDCDSLSIGGTGYTAKSKSVVTGQQTLTPTYVTIQYKDHNGNNKYQQVVKAVTINNAAKSTISYLGT